MVKKKIKVSLGKQLTKLVLADSFILLKLNRQLA